MKWLRDLTLHLLMLYCCDLPAPAWRSSWISGIRADDSPEQVTYDVKVDLSSNVHEIGDRFLSMSFPAKYTPVAWTDKLLNLASALSPADIRVLGKIDIFCPDENVKPSKTQEKPLTGGNLRDPCKNKGNGSEFVLRGNHWQIFNTNVAKAGWNLLLGFENVKRKTDGSWDSSLAEAMMNYSSSKGIPIRYFHLGNEPNLYPGTAGLTISPKTLVEDYRTLRRLVSKYPLYTASKMYGPDVTSLDKHATARNYLTQFLAAGAENVVDAISLHHYYCKNNATMQKILNLTSLESLRSTIEIGHNIVEAEASIPIILSETSSCSGGGAHNLSDRYVAGFLWLDKLGLSALYGVRQVFRQEFYSGASYSLVHIKDTSPQPDYYLSVLYKRLVQGPVFRVNLSPLNPRLRVYANCAKQGRYTPGDLVIYFINLEETTVVLSMEQFPEADLDLYMLTPGDNDNIQSRDVKLNGETLRMSGSELPPLSPKEHNGEVKVAAQSFGFLVVHGAHVSHCAQYFTKVEREGASKQ